jgi:hypothetical protein
MRRGAETGKQVVLIEHKQLEQGGRRGRGTRIGIAFYIRKHEQSHVGQFGGSSLNWNMSVAARFAPRPRRGMKDSFTFEFHRSWYATQEPCLAARHLGPWAESDGAAGR